MKNLIITALLLVMGCGMFKPQTVSTVQPNGPTDTIVSVKQDLKQDTEILTDTTNTIKTNATQGAAKTPPELKLTLDPYWNNILIAAGKQEYVIKDLFNIQGSLTNANAKADEMKAALVRETQLKLDAQEESKKDKAALNDALRTRMNYLIMFGVIGVAAAAGLLFAGYKAGIIVGVVSVVLVVGSMIVSTAIQVMEHLVPYIVGGVVLGCIGVAVWYIIKYKKDNKILTTATVEITDTAEKLKSLATDVAKKKIFGDGLLPGVAQQIQSESTQAIVANIRENHIDTVDEV
jgi:hypothetical protein